MKGHGGYKLCAYVKEDGKLCGSPAVRRRTYCYHHLNHLEKRRRMAIAGVKVMLREEDRRHAAAVKALLNSPWVKKMMDNPCDENILGDIYRVN